MAFRPCLACRNCCLSLIGFQFGYTFFFFLQYYLRNYPALDALPKLYSAQNKGNWCLSSHFPLALPQSKDTLMPHVISLCISQDLNWCQRKSLYLQIRLLVGCSTDPTIGLKYYLFDPHKSEIRSRTSGKKHWLTLGLDLTLKVPKLFLQTLQNWSSCF